MPKILEIKHADKIAVFGDIHGDLDSLKRGYDIVKKEMVSYIIFLGDYADRGPYGPEVIEFIQKKQKDDINIIPLKGNHEDYELIDSKLIPNFSTCNLISQYKRKLTDSNFKVLFTNLYNWFESLPVAVIVNGKYFLVHSGISSKVKIEENLDKKMVEDILWSDPVEMLGEYPNGRGAGVFFGPDITNRFLKKYNLKTIVRSHEPRKALNGYTVEHNGKVLTISSTTVYGGKAAVLIIDSKKPAMDAYELAKGIILI